MLFAGALAYWPVLGNGFLNLDDRVFIVDNPMIPEGLTLRTLGWALTADVLEDTPGADYWQPATLVSRLIDGSLYGLNPAGHHLTSLLLHLANAVLLLLLLDAATGRLRRSAAVALVFATHPLHVSSVAWVTERKDVLSVFFCLLALAAFARFAAAWRELREAAPASWGRVRVAAWYLLLAAGYALALMSKPMALPLPLVMLLTAYWPLPRERRPGLGRLALALAPLALPAAGAVFLYARVETVGIELDQVVVQPSLAFAGRLIVSLAAYPGRLLWPANLQHIYPMYPAPAAWPAVAGSLLPLAGLFALAAATARTRPWFAAGWLWYLVAILPAATSFQSSAAADRFSYFPVIGLTVAGVWGLGEATAGRFAAVRAIGAAAVVAALALTTRAETRHWKDSRTLCTHLLDLDPRHDIALRNLGVTLAEAGEPQRALELFLAALAVRPNSPTEHQNVGVALENLGRLDEAEPFFARAAALDPRAFQPRYSLGRVHLRQGDLDGALASFRDALRLRPRDVATLREIGYVHSLLGRPDAAADWYRRALEIDPASALLLGELGAALLELGQTDRAAALFRQALAADPGNEAALEGLRLLDGDGPGPGALGQPRR